ncbi:DUF1636 family protein [Roseixanthobacter glucoisosaccharinicivorans]|uniref:DUF1636 family protein n=1 Tax=Roseixanthobacter glucoisosaccharinicivorans TaxID=3119923 RepID=UPI003728DDD6
MAILPVARLRGPLAPMETGVERPSNDDSPFAGSETMVRSGTPADGPARDSLRVASVPAVTLFVCTTCKLAGAATDAPPAGAALAREAMRVAATGGDPAIAVKEVRCLSNCKRALSAALVRTGGWSYVFGDLSPDSAADLLTGAALFATSTDGILPWRGRPDSLKRGMVARIPPMTFSEDQR